MHGMTVRGGMPVLLLMAAAGVAVGQSPVFDPAGSVRGAGMNGAGTALMGDAGAIFANPVGIATVSHIALEGTYSSAGPDSYMATAAFAWRLRQFDFGAGVRRFDAGNGDRDLLGVGTLIYRYGMIAVGGSAKALRSRVGTVQENGFSLDAGLAIAVFDIMALGFSRQNVGGNWTDASGLPMPGVSRFGFTMNYVDPQETFRLLSTLEFQWAEGRGMRTVLGFEGGIVVSNAVGVIGRAAYGSRPGGLRRPRLTYGASVALTRLSFDYAFEPVVAGISSTQRVGVRLAL